MVVKKICSICGSAYHYQTFCPYKERKPIPQKGRETKRYELFRDKVAKPYLDKKYGHVCSYRGCTETEKLDVDHIKTRGAHHELKFDVKNLRYMCREHHRLQTDGKLENI